MSRNDIMRGFPPAPANQVTLANWRDAPHNRWGFQNVSQVVPVAPISRGQGPVEELGRDIHDLDAIAFESLGGEETTVGQYLLDSYTDGFIALMGGHVISERYFNGMAPDSRHIIFSVSKSVTASLTGIVVDRGQLDPDAPIADYVPEVAGSTYGDATVRHLLDMTVGVNFVEDYTDTEGDFARYRMSTGWNPAPAGETPAYLREFLPSLTKDGEHGAKFHYVSPNSDLLGWVLERATDTPFNVLLGRELWAPMGAEFDAYVAVDPLGAPRPAGGICVTLRDLARFGQMHIEGGLANNRQIIPEWWIRDMRENGDPTAWAAGDMSESMPNTVYRSKWYIMGNGAYCGLGIHGQTVYVDPSSGMVFAKQSSHPNAVDEALDDNLFRAFNAIAEALGV
jgi:CubicO group peptidase (beta-lactamase class C family)